MMDQQDPDFVDFSEFLEAVEPASHTVIAILFDIVRLKPGSGIEDEQPVWVTAFGLFGEEMTEELYAVIVKTEKWSGRGVSLEITGDDRYTVGPSISIRMEVQGIHASQGGVYTRQWLLGADDEHLRARKFGCSLPGLHSKTPRLRQGKDEGCLAGLWFADYYAQTRKRIEVSRQWRETFLAITGRIESRATEDVLVYIDSDTEGDSLFLFFDVANLIEGIPVCPRADGFLM